jgi:hypothetical protein
VELGANSVFKSLANTLLVYLASKAVEKPIGALFQAASA